MYRSLLVHIPTERPARPAVDGSVSLAMACGAHVEAMAIGVDATNIAFVAEGGAAVASILDMEHDRALERADAALKVFSIEAKNAKISFTCRPLAAPYAEAMSIAGAVARLHDLTVVSQPEPPGDTFDNQLPLELVMQSGGPVLFFPYTFRGAFRPARVGICWDGSRLAARAVRDAMPLLLQADAVTAIALNETDAPEHASAAQLTTFLARHDVRVDTMSLTADRGMIQSTILSVAADEGLDLLVMGGYGHSRLQETVLGGVTRAMFQSMTVPVLMSH